MKKQISSSQNPLIKQLLLLQEKSRERKKTGLFVVEGEREISLAVKAGYEMLSLIYCKDIYSESVFMNLTDQPLDRIEVPIEVYRKVAYREGTEGVLALVRSKKHFLEDIHFQSKAPLILVAEAPEKPGNIGAILRTADAAKVDAVLIANPKTDLYNPNVIRSSVGCLFTNQIGMGTTEEIISFLKEKDIALFGAALQASKNYTDVNFTKASAIIMGTESTGLSDTWLKNTTQNILIPMEGEIDSMNVSVAAAVLIFEAKRQRNLIKS